MEIRYQAGKYTEAVCDLLGFPIFEDQISGSTSISILDHTVRGLAGPVLSTGEFKPELNRTCLLHQPRGLRARRLLLVGAGKKAEFTLARLREVAGTAIRKARSSHCRTVSFLLPAGLPASEAFKVATEGALYGNFEPDSYKTKERKDKDPDLLCLLSKTRTSKATAEQGISRGDIIGHATTLARTLVNEPGNILTPSALADKALSLGAEAGLEVRILEKAELEQMGMNTILAVSRGSEEPPKVIVLRLADMGRQSGKDAPLFALVGKGVTFDSGGISLKPADKMEEMKADMAGGAAVLGAMTALARLGSRCPVIGLIPAVENLPSGRAIKPGDVVKSFLGKTVEITNTDAEGRLIMADALAYARKLGARRLVDIATLTGACVIALGHINAGMMGTDQKTMDLLRKNIPTTGERIWQLPLDAEYRRSLDSDIADIKNSGPRWGGAITAAKFLQEFAEETPWVHLDIAGMDIETEARPFAAKGPTGFGVRTLVQLLS